MCSLQQHNDKIIYMCFYFKNINFIMDIVPQMIKNMDDIYIDYIIKDAIHHGWRQSIFNDYVLWPPLDFECSRWASLFSTIHGYMLPHWIYDDHVRQKGFRKEEDFTNWVVTSYKKMIVT